MPMSKCLLLYCFPLALIYNTCEKTKWLRISAGTSRTFKQVPGFPEQDPEQWDGLDAQEVVAADQGD